MSYTEMLSCLDSLKPVVVENQFNKDNDIKNTRLVKACLDLPVTVETIVSAPDADTAITNAFRLANQAIEVQNLSAAEKVNLFRKIYREYKGYDQLGPPYSLEAWKIGAVIGGGFFMLISDHYATPFQILGVGVISAIIGAGIATTISYCIHLINKNTDKGKKLEATFQIRKTEFEGYMHQAGIDDMK